ncbi:MAG: hypothetical protein H6766_05985 [Candidatus Peribacteria bacterium]|nr:MAG: hypothetical protein H6766_05985 [Candidatus Peribacteria bacterium]
MIGASLLRLKLWGLSQIDPVYTDDLQQLYQYQCLIYGQRCDYVDTTRQDFSLHLSTRDADLQATTLSGSVEVGGLWESIKSVV